MQSVWESARAVAAEEAMVSRLPGYYDGPADAIRHIIGAAELRRRAGSMVAWTVVNSNEWQGEVRGYREALTAMDNANNAIGARARTYAEVVSMAREALRRGVEAGGAGAGGSPVWLPSGWSEPRNRTDLPPPGLIEWRDPKPGGGTYRFGGAEHAFLRGPRDSERHRLEDLAGVPPEAWSEDDARAVIRSRPYSDSRDPSRRIWQDRVRAYFEAQQARESGGATQGIEATEEECGGVANVRAYTRAGRNGPVRVGAHQRAVACG
jgi:hypothetical protein